MANPRPIEQDILKLRELGFNPGAPAAEALKRLAEIRASHEVSDVAVARALGTIEDAGAVRMLLEMEAGAIGALRREIRRSLFRLSRRGISGAVPGAAEPAKGSALEPAPVSDLTALMSPFDDEGIRVIWLIKARPGGGLVLLTGLVSEERGLLGVDVSNLKRRELRAQREHLEQRSGLRLVEVPPALADFTLCDAYSRTPVPSRGPVGSFYAFRAEVTAAPAPSEFVHPVYCELAAEAAGEPSVEVLKEPELAAFRIPAQNLKPWIEEMNRARESPILVSPASQQERVMAVVEKAVDGILTGDLAVMLRRRLEDAAYYMLKRGRHDAAGWACAAAARIRDHADLKRIPFFRVLIEAQLSLAIAEEAERKEAEPRLIMTPAEAVRARQQRGPLHGPRR